MSADTLARGGPLIESCPVCPYIRNSEDRLGLPRIDRRPRKTKPKVEMAEVNIPRCQASLWGLPDQGRRRGDAPRTFGSIVASRGS